MRRRLRCCVRAQRRSSRPSFRRQKGHRAASGVVPTKKEERRTKKAVRVLAKPFGDWRRSGTSPNAGKIHHGYPPLGNAGLASSALFVAHSTKHVTAVGADGAWSMLSAVEVPKLSITKTPQQSELYLLARLASILAPPTTNPVNCNPQGVPGPLGLPIGTGHWDWPFGNPFVTEQPHRPNSQAPRLQYLALLLLTLGRICSSTPPLLPQKVVQEQPCFSDLTFTC